MPYAITRTPQLSRLIAVSQELVKTGEQVYVRNPEMADADDSNTEALKRVLGLSLIGVGAGAGIRSLIGFRDMMARNAAKRKQQARPAVVEINVPTIAEEKQADGPTVPVPAGMQIVMPEKPGVLDRIFGRTQRAITDKPWFYTAAIGGPSLGVYGGYTLVDKLLERVHKKDRESELEKAKDDYRKAIVSQYTADQIKTGSVNNLANDLDELAGIVKNAKDTLGGQVFDTVAKYYLPIAAVLGTGAGLATYNWVKSRSPEDRVAKAIKQRERLRWASRPPEIYAITKSVPVKHNNDQFDDSTAEDREMVAKVASWYKP